MRAATRVAGSSIDRVFTQPTVPARRLRRAADAALTLALGSVCAFGLTLGPAPLNTVALSATASSLEGTLEPESNGILMPDEVDRAESGDAPPGASFRPRLPASSDSTKSTPATAAAEIATAPAPRPEAAQPSPPPIAQPSPQVTEQAPQPSAVPPPDVATGPPVMGQPSPLSVVENYRIASGFGAFVSADGCAQPVVHATVVVTPSLKLPPGQAKKSLAPDPAYATGDDGPGATKVTVYTCE